MANDGNTALWMAAAKGSVENVRYFLEMGYEVDELNLLQDIHGFTALGAAIYRSNLGIIRELLKWNASVEIRSGSRDYTLLHKACSRNGVDVVGLLLTSHPNLEVQEIRGYTPLHTAVETNRPDTVSLLINAGANIESQSGRGYTPLHCAVYRGNLNMVDLLIESGAELDRKSDTGYTPLHYATSMGYTEVVEMLLQQGANINSESDGSYTPLHCAAGMGNLDILWVLLRHKPNIYAETEEGLTPLKMAVMHEQTRTAAILRASIRANMVAFAMGLHPALGKGSSVHKLDDEMMRMVLSNINGQE
jgi:ankyrin repeat protein